MNCDQIKEKISIRAVLESLKIFPVRKNAKTAFYFALDREEKTPSFCVDYDKNKAFDFGSGKAYDIISIVQQINRCSVAEALNYLKNLNPVAYQAKVDANTPKCNYEILNIKKVEHLALLEYLKSRKVLDQKHLVKEVHYQLNTKLYFGLGFFNNSGGIEIRNKYSKICLGKKDVTLIKNPKNEKKEICVFEGLFDFLTYLNFPNVHISNSDFLILNSTAMFFKAEKELINYHKIVLFLDNDISGKNLTSKILDKYKNVEDCSILYKDFKDLNEWGVNKLILYRTCR